MNNDNIELIRKDIDSLLERLSNIDNAEANRNEIEEIRAELQRLNSRAMEIEQEIFNQNRERQENNGFKQEESATQENNNEQDSNIGQNRYIENNYMRGSYGQSGYMQNGYINQRYVQGNQGYTQDNQGYMQGNQGYIQGNQGYIQSNQGYVQGGQGYGYQNMNHMPPVITYGYNQNNGNISKLPPSTNTKEKSKDDIEKNLGTNVMSVLAALLIFIGVASLTAVVYTNFNNVMKSVVMTGLTLLVAGVGFLLLRSKESIFSYAITAIGIGGVYISLIASGMLGVLNLFVLAILVIGWTCLVHWQNLKYRSFIVSLIELLGFEIAIFVGLISLEASETFTAYLLILLNIIYWIAIEHSNKLDENIKVIFDLILISSKIKTLTYMYLGNFGLMNLFEIVDISALDIFNTIVYTSLLFIILIDALKEIKKLLANNYVQNDKAIAAIGCILTHIIVVMIASIFIVKVNLVSDGSYFKYLGFDENINSLIEAVNQLFYIDLIGIFTLLYCFYINSNGLRKIGDKFSKILSYVLVAFGLFWCFVQYVSVYYDLCDYREALASVGILNLAIIIGSYKISYLVSKYTNDTFYRRLGLIFITKQVLSYFVLIGNTYDSGHINSWIEAIIITGLFIIELGLLCRSHIEYAEDFAKRKSVLDKSLHWISMDICLLVNMMLLSKIWRHYFDFSGVMVVVIAPIIHLLFNVSGYFTEFTSLDEIIHKDTSKRNDGSYRIFLVMNLVLILFICGIWDNAWDFFRKFYYILPDDICNIIINVTCTLSILMLTFLGTSRTLEKNGKFGGFIIGIKYAVILNIILHMYADVTDMSRNINLGVMYSIVLLAMCVIFIAYGWVIKNKSLRLFGLLGIIFSILKLLFIDIHFTNSLVRTCAYIISGIMCAMIVWIYDKVSDKNHEK